MCPAKLYGHVIPAAYARDCCWNCLRLGPPGWCFGPLPGRHHERISHGTMQQDKCLVLEAASILTVQLTICRLKVEYHVHPPKWRTVTVGTVKTLCKGTPMRTSRSQRINSANSLTSRASHTRRNKPGIGLVPGMDLEKYGSSLGWIESVKALFRLDADVYISGQRVSLSHPEVAARLATATARRAPDQGAGRRAQEPGR